MTIISAYYKLYLVWKENFYFAEIAQLVEHFTRNEGVEGSSPFFGLEKDLVNILSVFIRSFAVTTPSGTVQ